MSDLTDFFPAASGGGAVSNNPMDLPAGASGISRLKIKNINSNTTSSTDTTPDFWLPYQYQGGVYTGYTTSDIGSYVTITDISSAPNGGRFFNVIGPAVNTNNPTSITTFKITVDGTEYIISDDPQGTYPGGYYGRAWMGNILYSGPPVSSTANTQYKDRNSYLTRVQSTAYLIGGQFISPSRTSAVDALVPSWPYDGPSIRFNESLKVEVKVVGALYVSSAPYNNAGTVVSVFN